MEESTKHQMLPWGIHFLSCWKSFELPKLAGVDNKNVMVTGLFGIQVFYREHPKSCPKALEKPDTHLLIENPDCQHEG